MGKNTMMKRSIKLYCETSGNDKWKVILEHLVNNVGIVFTNGDLNDVKDEINKYKVGGEEERRRAHTHTHTHTHTRTHTHTHTHTNTHTQTHTNT